MSFSWYPQILLILGRASESAHQERWWLFVRSTHRSSWRGTCLQFLHSKLPTCLALSEAELFPPWHHRQG